MVKENISAGGSFGKISTLERVLALIISHVGQSTCVCSIVDSQWSFSSQILTIPFVWQLFPYLKVVNFFLLVWDFRSRLFEPN